MTLFSVESNLRYCGCCNLNRQVIVHEFVRLRRVFRKFAPFGSRFWVYAVLDLELLMDFVHY
jgi:hypothetical protein